MQLSKHSRSEQCARIYIDNMTSAYIMATLHTAVERKKNKKRPNRKRLSWQPRRALFSKNVRRKTKREKPSRSRKIYRVTK